LTQSTSTSSADVATEREGSSLSASTGTETEGTSPAPQRNAPPMPQKNTSRIRKRPPKEVPRHEKDKLVDLCVKFCALDLRPFNVVNGQGFKKVTQALVNIGADYGRVDAESVLPHSSTISRRTSTVAEKIRQKFLPEVKQALKNESCSFDADMWSDKYTKTAYLTTTAQYVTPDFELKSLVLFTTAFPADEKKTGDNIREYSTTALNKLGISEEEVAKVTYVTDAGANMIKAYADCNRLSCVAHNLVTVLRHLFDEKFLKVHAPTIHTSLEVGRSIVGYLKRTGLCRLLPHSVKTLLEVRWDSVVDMVFSVCDGFPYIIEILRGRNEQHRMDGWDGELMTELMGLLLEFKKVTKEIQSKKVPTIHTVQSVYCKKYPGGEKVVPFLWQRSEGH